MASNSTPEDVIEETASEIVTDYFHLRGHAADVAAHALIEDEVFQALARLEARATQTAVTINDTQTDLQADDYQDIEADTRAALQTRAAEAVIPTLRSQEVHGHQVDLRHSRVLPCPECGENTEAFYVDSVGGRPRWVCHHCGALVETDEQTGEITDSQPPQHGDVEHGDREAATDGGHDVQSSSETERRGHVVMWGEKANDLPECPVCGRTLEPEGDDKPGAWMNCPTGDYAFDAEKMESYSRSHERQIDADVETDGGDA